MFDAKMTRRTFATTMGVGALAALAGCGGGGGAAEGGSDGESITVEMVTDTGGVNDQSFNQLAWAGMQQLKTDNGWEVNYYESKQDSDYATNLDKAVDDGSAIVSTRPPRPTPTSCSAALRAPIPVAPRTSSPCSSGPRSPRSPWVTSPRA